MSVRYIFNTIVVYGHSCKKIVAQIRFLSVFLDAIASPSSYPVGKWVSQRVIESFVNSNRISIFASLFLDRFLTSHTLPPSLETCKHVIMRPVNRFGAVRMLVHGTRTELIQ